MLPSGLHAGLCHIFLVFIMSRRVSQVATTAVKSEVYDCLVIKVENTHTSRNVACINYNMLISESKSATGW